jgi:FkbM family methyltransferase
VARPTQPRPRTRFDRLLARHISTAPPRLLKRYARRLSPTQTLERRPGWSFASASSRDDLGTFVRGLIWQRFRDERTVEPVEVEWCRGLKLRLRLGNDLSWWVFVGGMYEPNELAFLATTLEPGMTVVDVGANEGLFTLVGASLVGGGGRVIAIEPSERELAWLQANVELNGLDNVEAFRFALHDHAGTSKLTRADIGHEGYNALGDTIVSPEVNAAGTETVELETLDGFVTARGLERLDVVKVDAEGCEARILQGGMATVRRFSPIVLMEVVPDHLAAQGSTVVGLLDLIDELAYRVWIFEGQGLLRLRSGDEPLSENVVAAPTGWRPPVYPSKATPSEAGPRRS